MCKNSDEVMGRCGDGEKKITPLRVPESPFLGVFFFCFLNVPLFGTAGGAAGSSTSATGGTGGALKLSATRKGKGRHRPVNFLALAFRAGNLLRSTKY